MQSEYSVIITALGTTIAGLAGFIVWLFKDALRRADERIEVLEERERTTLIALAENVRGMRTVLETVAEIVRELRLSHERAARLGGDR